MYKVQSIMRVLCLLLLAGTMTFSVTSCSEKENDEPGTVIPPSNNQEQPKDSTNTEKPDTPVVTTACEGWPAEYDGVMLQGFFWDSYSDSKWALLTAQADELAQYFSLIWVPNSGKTSDFYHTGRNTMGYDPCFWLDHNSCWGTEAELKKMVSTFATKETGIIEDVVINHKNGLTSWVDFPDETNGTYSVKWDNDNFSAICSTDECNTAANLSKWSKGGKKTTGASDTGDDFGGYRDLDHTNEAVQQNVKTYLSFLLKEIGYAGFRYDMVKGYGARYTGLYNATAKPKFSVGECWDSNKSVVTNWINGTKQDGQIQSAAFDFPLKYKINAAFGSGSWGQLAQNVLANDKTYQRYAVTFVDNHDTYRENTRLRTNVCAANAFILTMPGTPCLFLKHWQQNKGTLKRLIALRRAAGINSQSEIHTAKALDGGFALGVTGTKSDVLLILGNATDAGIYADKTLAMEGKNFKLYIDVKADLSELRAITDVDVQPEDNAPVTIPEFCTVAEGETCAFFEAPTSWTSTIKCWAWIDNGSNFTGGSWPGTSCTLLGEAPNGRKVWKWTYTGTLTTKPAMIIFSNNGTPQTEDLTFINGGYYTEDGLQGKVEP